MNIRIRDTGIILSEMEFRHHFDVPHPVELTPELLDGYGADFVLDGVRPTPQYWFQIVADAGVEQIDGQWFTRWELIPADVDPVVDAAFLAAVIVERQGVLIAAIGAERDRRFYTNITVQFPDGPGEVQFRDEVDRANFASVVQGAQVVVASGNPLALVSYITADNQIRSFPAEQMLPIGLAVLAAKQAIIQGARLAKDYVLSLGENDLQALHDYDPVEGW